jgi:hypothetical protein
MREPHIAPNALVLRSRVDRPGSLLRPSSGLTIHELHFMTVLTSEKDEDKHKERHRPNFKIKRTPACKHSFGHFHFSDRTTLFLNFSSVNVCVSFVWAASDVP